MMALLQKHTGNTHALHLSLARWTKSLWVSAGVLFLCYIYFVGAITFAVVAERSRTSEVKSLISSIAVEESSYLASQRTLTKSVAIGQGFVVPHTVAFATPKKAFAWNVGR